MNKKKIVVISAIALIIVMQFFLIDYFYETKQKQLSDIYNKGHTDGLTDAVSAIYYNLASCEPTSISVNNFTKYIIDVECLIDVPSTP